MDQPEQHGGSGTASPSYPGVWSSPSRARDSVLAVHRVGWGGGWCISLVCSQTAPACSESVIVRKMLPLGDWLEREDPSMRASIKTLFQWLHGEFLRAKTWIGRERSRNKEGDECLEAEEVRDVTQVDRVPNTLYIHTWGWGRGSGLPSLKTACDEFSSHCKVPDKN